MISESMRFYEGQPPELGIVAQILLSCHFRGQDRRLEANFYNSEVSGKLWTIQFFDNSNFALPNIFFTQKS